MDNIVEKEEIVVDLSNPRIPDKQLKPQVINEVLMKLKNADRDTKYTLYLILAKEFGQYKP